MGESGNIVEHVNEYLADYFPDHREYTSALAVFFYWKGHDLDLENPNAPNYTVSTEISALRNFLEGELRFETATCGLESANPEGPLLTTLAELLFRQDSPRARDERCLLVFYYAGHNDRNERNEAELAAVEKGGPTLPWSVVQSTLNRTKGDVLLLFDCCHAAVIANSQLNKPQGRLHLLAASAEGVQTPRPGPRSFSTLLVKHMQRLFRSQSVVPIAQLESEMIHDKALTETSIYVSLTSVDLTSITLHPLREPGAVLLQRRPKSSLIVNVDLADDVTEMQLINWLKTSPPPNVTAIAIEAMVSKACRLQGTLPNGAVMPRSIFDKISEPARKEMLAQLSKLNAAITSATDLAKRAASSELVAKTWASIVSATASAADALSCPNLLDISEADLEEIKHQARAEEPGLQDTIHLRQLIMGAEAESSRLQIDLTELSSNRLPGTLNLTGSRFKIGVYQGRDVLVEYSNHIRTKVQVVRTASLLHIQKPAVFRMLRCRGYVEEIINGYGMVFELPASVDSTLIAPRPPRTLRDLFDGMRRIALGQRFLLAYRITVAVDALHRVGWIHKNINSDNIIFLSDVKLDESILENQPWLVGFDYTRSEDARSYREEDHRLQNNLYRNPDRWGRPSRDFTRTDDLHSLGVVLAEIAFWKPVTSWKPIVPFLDKYYAGPIRAEEIVDKIRVDYQKTLPHVVGQTFTDAIDACFDFSEATVNMTESEKQRHMQVCVRDRLKMGVDTI